MGTPEPSHQTRSLRRSLFFVPGGDRRKLEKARDVGADTLLLDLEDSVPIEEKERARDLVSAFLGEGATGRAEPAVRVNPPGSPWFEEDLQAAVASGAAAIMLPKAERADEIARVAALLETIEPAHAGAGSSGVRLLALVETAAGVARVSSLADASPRIDALCFGHADFSRDMGLADALPDRGVLLHARCAVAIAAHASGVAAVDTVHLDVRDEAGFRADALLGRELGFEGKLCIHPLQVGIANDVHTPSPPQIAYARRVIEADRSARAEGRGAFTVDGRMVDAPLVAAQEKVLERARRAGVAEEAGEDDER